MFYIQENRRTVGNSATWWKKGDRGYTCHLEEAGQYTEKEMLDRTKSSEDIGWPVELAESFATQQVDIQKMDHWNDTMKKLDPEKVYL